MTPSTLDSGEVTNLESIIITDELHRRPSRPPDYQAENSALTSLAVEMANAPESILQKLSEMALKLCRAHSAGISLLKGNTFYWPALCGQWAFHIGGGTPREYGPCGTVLDRNTALLIQRPERYFSYLRPVMPAAEEVLLVPFYIEGIAVGTVWVIAHDPSCRFDLEDLRLITNLGNFAGVVYQTLQSESEAKRSAALLAGQKRVLEMLASGDGLVSVLTALLRFIEEQSDGLLGSFFIRREANGHFGLGVAPSLPVNYVEALQHMLLTPPYPFPCVKAAHSGETVSTNDIAGDTEWSKEWRDLALSCGLRTCFSAPVFGSNGSVLGAFGLYERDPDRKITPDPELVKMAASLAGIVIENKRREEEVRIHRELIETVLNHLPSAAALVRGKDLTFQIVNPAYQALAPEKKMIGRSIHEVWLETMPRTQERCRQVLKTGEPFYATDEFIPLCRSISGLLEAAYFSWSMHRVTLPREEGWGILISIWETTARKQAEKNLEKTAADLKRSNEELEQFAYVASHDLQEPLRIVSVNAEMLAEFYSEKLDGEAGQIISFITGGARRAQQLIRDLLSFSKTGSGIQKLEKVDCNDLIKKAMANLDLSLKEKSAVVTCDPLPVVRGNAVGLLQVFQNLIANAVKFNPEKIPPFTFQRDRRVTYGFFPCRTTASASNLNFWTEFLSSFSVCTGKASMRGRALGWRSARKSWSATAGKSG